jgi:UDP-N-acetylglucosamine 2-epimerase (non-hydrolysing)
MVDVLCVVGARPNFPKVAPIVRALARTDLTHAVVHTEQHYDDRLSGVFLRELDMPQPDVGLGVGSGSHAQQTARVMLAFEPVLADLRPGWVVVVGDVNSTVACALTAAKMGVPVAHVEAGLRSRDRGMPEELNRIVTDQLSELCLTPSSDADANLLAEGISADRIARVGNVMIDTLAWALPRARALGLVARLGLAPRSYALATIHRPSNVDTPEALARIVDILAAAAKRLTVVFPAHPRTRQRLDDFGLTPRLEAAGVRLCEPVGYWECVALEADARIVLTDSGGIQEETTFLGVPCLTLRENTERPITVTEGTNRVVGADPIRVREAIAEELDRDVSGGGMRRAPELWDGRAAQRIVAELTARMKRSLPVASAGAR